MRFSVQSVKQRLQSCSRWHFGIKSVTQLKSVTLQKYSDSAWIDATEKQSLTYNWYAQDKDGNAVTFSKTGKVIYLSAADTIAYLHCSVMFPIRR